MLIKIKYDFILFAICNYHINLNYLSRVNIMIYNFYTANISYFFLAKFNILINKFYFIEKIF